MVTVVIPVEQVLSEKKLTPAGPDKVTTVALVTFVAALALSSEVTVVTAEQTFETTLCAPVVIASLDGAKCGFKCLFCGNDGDF